MNYLLDTNACIALINGAPASVRAHFEDVTSAGAQIFVSSIVAFELWYGAAKSSHREFNRERLIAFFGGLITLLPFDEEDAHIAGAIRASLEMIGRPVGAYDVLIAGQAVRHKFTLVTADTDEFARIKGLPWQDWAAMSTGGGSGRS